MMHCRSNALRLLVLVVVATGFLVGTRAEAKKRKHNDEGTPSPTPAAAPQKEQQLSGELSRYITDLDALLALDRPKAARDRLDHEAGELAVLRGKFAAEASTASAPQKTVFANAAAVCDALTGALDERQKALTQISAVSSVSSSSTLNQPAVKDHPGAFAYDRELRAKHAAEVNAHKQDEYFVSQPVNAWRQRSGELRGQIQARYNALQAAEAAATASPTPGK